MNNAQRPGEKYYMMYATDVTTYLKLKLVRDVYLTIFMFRRRRTRTECEKRDAQVEIRVKVNGCKILEVV